MLVGFSTFHSFFLCVFCRYLTWLLCMVLVNCGVFVSKYLVSRLLSTRLSVSMLGKIPHQKQKYWWNGLINIHVQTLALDSSDSLMFNLVPILWCFYECPNSNSFSKALLGVTMLRTVGPNILSTFECSCQQFHDESLMFKCHFDRGSRSKVIFPKPPPNVISACLSMFHHFTRLCLKILNKNWELG